MLTPKALSAWATVAVTGMLRWSALTAPGFSPAERSAASTLLIVASVAPNSPANWPLAR